MSQPVSVLSLRPKVPRTAPREPFCPFLPPELWIRVLSHHSDLAHLWTACRRVSKTFSAYTEQVFANYHLRDTSVDWQLEKYNLGGKSRRPEIPTSFQRFSEDREKRYVYFRDKRKKRDVVGQSAAERNGGYERVMERWKENVRSMRPEMPNYTIAIAGMVNDTELPGLTINVEKREIRLDWRKMLHAFFREQKCPGVLKLGLDGPDSYPAGDAETAADRRKYVRRARLKEQYAGDEEMLWAINSLRHYEVNLKLDARASKALSEIPGAGIGEKWFGSTYLLQAMYLDEWSCLNRIDTKLELLSSTVY